MNEFYSFGSPSFRPVSGAGGAFRWLTAPGAPGYLAGKAQGGHADATAGLMTLPDPRPGYLAVPWYWNPSNNEWQMSHIMNPEHSTHTEPYGQNDPRGIAKLWYGSESPENIAKLARAPQNVAIMGAQSSWTTSSPFTDAFEYDVILIPGLPPPGLPSPPPAGTPVTPGFALPGAITCPAGQVNQNGVCVMPTGAPAPVVPVAPVKAAAGGVGAGVAVLGLAALLGIGAAIFGRG